MAGNPFIVGGASDFALPAAPLKTCFILNPRSGGATRALSAVRSFAHAGGAALRLTEHPRHATTLAGAAREEGFELIVAVGGDGTMNEVATALVGTTATFGLVPCGSGDGLGRHLGLHGSAEHALGILQNGRPHRIDTGLADGHPFFTAAGLGFEAEIAHRFNGLRQRGFLRYLTTSASALREWQPQAFTVTAGGVSQGFRAFTLAVSNANQYGNNARIAPDARIDDGLLDLCVVPPVRLWNALPLALRLFRGTIDRGRNVTMQRAQSFSVMREAPGLLHTDGEIHQGGTRIEFTVRPGSLRVMVPA